MQYRQCFAATRYVKAPVIYDKCAERVICCRTFVPAARRFALLRGIPATFFHLLHGYVFHIYNPAVFFTE